MKNFLRHISQSRHGVIRQRSDLWLALGAAILTAVFAYFAAQDTIAAWEISLFRLVNNLPGFLYPVIWIFMQYGVFVTIPVAAAASAYFKQRRLAIMMLLGGVGIYCGALILKSIVDRGRPGDIIPDVITREHFRYLSLGFTSGHTAVASTIATFAHRYLPRPWQILSIVTLAIVAFGRIYIGGHLPLDVVAGISLGVAFASIINYLFGIPKNSLALKEAAEGKSLIKLVRVHRPRHPGDIVRLVLGCLVFGIATLLALTSSVSGIEEYLFRLINNFPNFISPIIQLIMQTGALYFVPIAAVIALLYKHPRLAIKIGSGGLTVWLLTKLAKALVHRDRPHFILSGIIERAQNSGILGFPSGHAAIAALIATVASAYLKKSWSRVLWTLAWIVAFSRMYVGAHLPLDIFAGLAMGWVFGSILNLLLGTPEKPMPHKQMLATLKLAGLKIKHVVAAHVDARGSTPLLAETADGKQYFIKLVNNEHRNADILFKLWRYFTLREVEDEAPFATAKQLVEHEAYMYHQAERAGARVPDIKMAATVTPNAAILLSAKINGATLDKYNKPFTAELLEAIWQQVNLLRQARIAHRDLRSANVLIDAKNRPWLIDFSFAESAASDRRLTIDIVELLASLSLQTDPNVVVQSAIKVLGKKPVAASLPYIQSAALSSVTRRKYKRRKMLLERLRSEVQAQSKTTAVRSIKVKRFGYETVVWFVMGILLIYFILSQAGNLSEYTNSLRSFHIGWIAAALLASLATYVMSALVILGASRQALAYGRTLVLQVATSFVNRITPKSLGGVAVTERYLENSGLSRPEAMATISLSYFSGFIVHTSLMAILLIGLTRHPVSIDMPEGWSLIAIIIGAMLLASLSFVPKVKNILKKYISEGIKSIRYSMTTPVKVGQLGGGALGVTLFYCLAFYFSLLAFNISIPLEQALLVYLAGSVIASAAPTPGGLGAAEASLAGGLIAIGVATGPAVTAVLAFRILTFWLPILPGVFSLRYLQKQHLL